MLGTGYSTREVARLVNLPETRIRAYARAGLVGRHISGPSPVRRRWLRFDFHDILVLRTAAQLLSEGLSSLRVRRALAALRRAAPAQAPLAGATIYGDQGKIIATNSVATWHPESGQCLLRFSAKRANEDGITTVMPRQEAALDRAGTLPSETVFTISADMDMQTADRWFDMALEAEESDPQQAFELYLRALACDPKHVEAIVNLGRLCSVDGDYKRALAYFRQATRMDPAHPIAHFNLAVTLHDLGDLRSAADAYEVALLHDPHFADAHYNLAMLLEQEGDAEEAIRHFQAYRAVSRKL